MVRKSKEFSYLKEETSFIKLMMKSNVTMLNKYTIFSQFLWENFDKDIYILFYKYSKIPDKAMAIFQMMLQNRVNSDNNSLYAAISYDIWDESESSINNSKDSKISLYRKTELLIDVYEPGYKAENSSALWTLKHMQDVLGQISEQVMDFKNSYTNNMYSKLTEIKSSNEIDWRNKNDKIKNLETKLNTLNDKCEADFRNKHAEINSLKNNSIPVGFIYVEHHNRKSPSALWPGSRWTDRTAEYSGQFFRALGGGSESFGRVQEDSARHISQDDSQLKKHHPTESGYHDSHIDLRRTGWSDFIQTSTDDGWSTWLRYFVPDNEVRPKNQAIKIWERTA